jgi:predicted  nucleic acid-binding Zn-ribbon protein
MSSEKKTAAEKKELSDKKLESITALRRELKEAKESYENSVRRINDDLRSIHRQLAKNSSNNTTHNIDNSKNFYTYVFNVDIDPENPRALFESAVKSIPDIVRDRPPKNYTKPYTN